MAMSTYYYWYCPTSQVGFSLNAVYSRSAQIYLRNNRDDGLKVWKILSDTSIVYVEENMWIAILFVYLACFVNLPLWPFDLKFYTTIAVWMNP